MPNANVCNGVLLAEEIWAAFAAVFACEHAFKNVELALHFQGVLVNGKLDLLFRAEKGAESSSAEIWRRADLPEQPRNCFDPTLRVFREELVVFVEVLGDIE
eukprot:CAMPEP_0170184376 /NCGR_PEP_ID=MMETSP0040_2-20121228/33476_1 /TAXON_ID=641309 /ORGANISM="Lotharella oceanica, Strain CCMP622" /LENGTH=101 /DNA_ID=CAMNT_0010430429 /DNA_START=458 /DNA_END=764 /DNA_ORIENTATION=-